MTYSYSAPMAYGPQQDYFQYDNSINYKKPSSTAPVAVAGAVIGAGVGAAIGNRKNPYINKNGEVADSFAKDVYEKCVNKLSEATKKSYDEGLNILEKIDEIKTPEELKTLFESNKEAAKDFCNELKQTPEEYLSKISSDNLASNKNIIKEKFNLANKTRYQDMKNQIQSCWDKKAKKFIKNDKIKDDVFKTIKKSTSGAKAKIIGKYALFCGACFSALGLLAKKLLFNK